MAGNRGAITTLANGGGACFGLASSPHICNRNRNRNPVTDYFGICCRPVTGNDKFVGTVSYYLRVPERPSGLDLSLFP